MQISSHLAIALGFQPDEWWDGFEPGLTATDEYGAGWFWPVQKCEGRPDMLDDWDDETDPELSAEMVVFLETIIKENRKVIDLAGLLRVIRDGADELGRP